MLTQRSWLFSLACLAISAGCSSSSTKNDSGTIPSTIEGGTANDASDGSSSSGSSSDGATAATWTAVYTTVISQRCTPCHTTPSGIGVVSGHLDMTSQAVAYQDLVNVAASGTACAGNGTRVVPGSPDASVMYLKVSLDDPAPCGNKMPFGGPPLPQSEADMIESWIMAGAQND